MFWLFFLGPQYLALTKFSLRSKRIRAAKLMDGLMDGLTD